MDLEWNPCPRFTQWILENQLIDEPFVLVDIGVQGGIHPRWDALGGYLVVHGFDPLEETIVPLVAANRKGHHYYVMALGNSDGESTLNVPEISFAASFCPIDDTSGLDSSGYNDIGNYVGVTQRNVPVRSMDSLMRSGILEKADFIKMDCEGFEPQVLQGAQAFLQQNGIFGIETETRFSVTPETPNTHFCTMLERLAPYGLRPIDLNFVRTPYAKFMRQAEALGYSAATPPSTQPQPRVFNLLFFRDFSAKWESHHQVLKAAMALELYRMNDTAYELLSRSQDFFPRGFPLRDASAKLIYPPTYHASTSLRAAVRDSITTVRTAAVNSAKHRARRLWRTKW